MHLTAATVIWRNIPFAFTAKQRPRIQQVNQLEGSANIWIFTDSKYFWMKTILVLVLGYIWLDIVVQPLWQIFFASLSCILWESWEHLGRRSSLFDSGTQRIPTTYTRVKERCCSQSKEFQRTTSTLNAQKSDFCNGLGLELLILFFWNFYPIATIRVPSIVGLPSRLTSFWIISSQNSSIFLKFPQNSSQIFHFLLVRLAG